MKQHSRPMHGVFTGAFLYERGRMTALFPGDNLSIASDINNSGQLTGTALAPSGRLEAFIRYGDSTIFLGGLRPGGSVGSYGLAINERGQVVGYANTSTAWRAFLYSDGVMTDLGTLSNRTDSFALDINGAGTVVGYASTNYERSLAVVYQDGVMHDLNNLTRGRFGHTLETANAIDEAGQIAVTGRSRTTGLLRAFLLTPIAKSSR
jgi:probable HAF family extracellular repeat protein